MAKIKSFFKGFLPFLFGKPTAVAKSKFDLDKFRRVADQFGLTKSAYDIAAAAVALIGADNTVKADLKLEKDGILSKIRSLRDDVARITRSMEALALKKRDTEAAIAPNEAIMAELEAMEKLIS